MLLTQDARFADDALDLLFDAGATTPEFGVLGPEAGTTSAAACRSPTAFRSAPTGGPRHLVQAPAAEDGIMGVRLARRCVPRHTPAGSRRRRRLRRALLHVLRGGRPHAPRTAARMARGRRRRSAWRTADRRPVAGPGPTPTCACATASSSRAARQDRSACSGGLVRAVRDLGHVGAAGRCAPAARARRGAPPSPASSAASRGLVDVGAAAGSARPARPARHGRRAALSAP